MVDVLTIKGDVDVINHYQKQKSEFHFDKNKDSDFLMFLLDTAVRVISVGVYLWVGVYLCVYVCVCVCVFEGVCVVHTLAHVRYITFLKVQ